MIGPAGGQFNPQGDADFQGAVPGSVRRAVTCLAVSAALAAVLAAVAWMGFLRRPAGASKVGDVLTVGTLSLVAWRIAAGKGWARWLFIVLYALGTPVACVLLLVKPELFRTWPAVTVAGAFIHLALQTIALALLFARSSREWFRRQRVRPKQSRAR